MVQILPGPDSNLYVVVLSVTGSQVRRIRYVGAGNTPPTAVANATPTIGTVPLTVTFSSLGSFDPDNQPLSYGWTFGDGATSTQQNPTHTYTAAGVYTATLTVTELTSPFASRGASVLITVGNEPPLATITAPPDGTIYKIGDIITYSGFGTSGGQPIDPSQLTWDVRLHHNEHMHFSSFPPGSGGTFQIIEHGDNTFYELCLTATVPPSLTDTRCVNLLPQLTTITLTTTPPGLFINYEDEGLTQASPMIIHTVVGGSQTASVQPVQGGLTFTGWADGEPSTSHPFLVGTTSVTFTAQYVNRPPVALVQASPVTGTSPLTVVFDGSGSSDPELTTLVYGWDFGDGTTSTQASPVHTYTASGTYQAVLTVTDQRNGSASQAVTITVNAPPSTCGNGHLDPGEQCDGGACCTSGCQFANAVTVCRPAAGACDVAETCSGASAACPADLLRPSGFVCRGSAGACDVAETCSGASTACPANGFVQNGTSCSDGNLCNGAETCQAGTCTAGTALVCNDNNVCTTDTCAPATGCVFTNNTAPCSDGVACTNDVCAGGTCTSTPACTGVGETCNLVTGACDPPAGGFTIWPSSTVPPVIAGVDIPVELGVKFRSDVAGYVTGIRFYKDARNTGTHVGNLWSNTGTRLATATFTNETASGWQQVNLSPPVAIAANTTYIASYFAPVGFYAISLNYFTGAGFDRPPLHALRAGIDGPDGVFAYNATSAFPTGTYADSNYWVDVAFSSTAPALQSIAVTPANPTATVGGTRQFTATGTYADSSTQNLTSQVTWASTSTSVATINATGLATAVAAGTTTIRATLGSVSGTTTLTVSAPPALSITTSALPGGTQGQAYTATLAASGGTPPYTWAVTSGVLPAGLTLAAGSGVISGTPTAAGTSNFTVQVTAGAQTATKALSIVIAAPVSSTWPSSTVPPVIAGSDLPVELGVKFRSDVSGYITGIRFYKDSRNTGTHIGSLWTTGGTRLAQATFSGETASGWQQVNFASPVAITANTTYVASYFCPVGFYAISLNYFASQGVDTPPLHLPSTGSAGGNGVFAYNATSAFPNQTYAASNYWIDVVFSAVAPALQSIAVTPASPTVTVGGTQQFTATGTYADSSTQNLTNQVTWSSTNTAVATINTSGLATTASTGSTTIRATLGAVSGTASLTVSPQAAVSITTTALPGGTQGAAYSTTLAASGGTPPYTWSLASGTLPPGLALGASSGVISGTPTATGTYSFTVQVAAGAQTATKALSIVVAPAVTSIWAGTTVPPVIAAGDLPVELGLKFRSDVAGYIRGIRFYKDPRNTGTHVANLWSVTGTRLAQATFTGETASGWQQVNFATPVAIAANTVYIASYFAPVGFYAISLNYFATQGVDTPPLHALATGVSGPNGVFRYNSTSAFPNTSYAASNYWVDVVFSTTP
jgi:PKD repeat protein